jgi:hypothetical protein
MRGLLVGRKGVPVRRLGATKREMAGMLPMGWSRHYEGSLLTDASFGAGIFFEHQATGLPTDRVVTWLTRELFGTFEFWGT